MSRSHARRCARHPERVAKDGELCAECAGRPPGLGELARRLEMVGLYGTAEDVRKGRVQPGEVVARLREQAQRAQEPVRSLRLALADEMEDVTIRRPRAARPRRAAVVEITDAVRTGMLRGKPHRVVWPAPPPATDAVKPKRPDLVGESFEVDVRVLRQGGEEVDRFTVTCTDMQDREDGDYDVTIVAGDKSDPVRLLVAQHGVPVGRDGKAIDEDGDYTSVAGRALREEMEAVSESVQKAITAKQMQAFAEQNIGGRRQIVRTARARLQRLERRARDSDVDLAPELAVIERQIEQAEQKVREAEEAMQDAA